MQGSLLIDISRLMGRVYRGRIPTGVDRVCLAYVAQFKDQAQAVIQTRGWRRILPYRESQELFGLLQHPGPSFILDAARLIGRVCMTSWSPQKVNGRVYFNLGHTGLEQAGMAAWVMRNRQKAVFMVHDLIPVTHPEYCRPGERERHVGRMRTVLKSGAGIVTNSQATLGELQQFARAAGLVLPPVAVAPLAPAALPMPVDSTPPLPYPYFVVVGTIEPRKNHLLLLNVWRELAAQLGGRVPHLVVIGQRGWECENVVDMLERCEALRGIVHELHACSDSELARYLGHARALLFPSFAEGYGLPLAEALMLGTPVIANDLPAFREIAGDVPDYIDPLDGPEWASAVREYALPGSASRAAQLHRMDRFALPTWPRHFEHVQSLLERLR
jgi:glycosyltransferase involved in cell wall biosynthesis